MWVLCSSFFRTYIDEQNFGTKPQIGQLIMCKVQRCSFFGCLFRWVIFLTSGIYLQKQNSTDGVSSAPFHMGVISGNLWLQYGLLKGDQVSILFESLLFLVSNLVTPFFQNSLWKVFFIVRLLQTVC